MSDYKVTYPINSGYLGWCAHNQRWEVYSEEQAERFVKENPKYKLYKDSPQIGAYTGPREIENMVIYLPDNKYGLFRSGIDLYTLVQQFPPCTC